MPEYRVRGAIFNTRGRAVYYPTGSGAGSRRHGFSISPPPAFKPPKEKVWKVATYAQARRLVAELRLEHGGEIVVHIKPIDTAPVKSPPVQGDLATLGNWPQQRRADDD